MEVKNITEHFNEEAQKHDNNFINNMGLGEFYDEIERQINKCSVKDNILVLGCGTGLEIERIKFKANVVAVDISGNMIEELKKKEIYHGISLKTVCASFLDMDFGNEFYDIVLSCYAMHHFTEAQKILLYKKIYNCLSKDGEFINGDVMENTREAENFRFKEAENIYKDKNLSFGSLHIDIPFCFEHELQVLKTAGFENITIEREWDKTKLYRASKSK